MKRLAWLRLLAPVLLLGLVLSSLPAAAHHHAHAHASSAVVTAEASSIPAPGEGTHEEACLACHVHCGCHVGVLGPTFVETAVVSAVRKTAAPASDHPRLSAFTAPLIRPPRA